VISEALAFKAATRGSPMIEWHTPLFLNLMKVIFHLKLSSSSAYSGKLKSVPLSNFNNSQYL
jgi:hypothetical protein